MMPLNHQSIMLISSCSAAGSTQRSCMDDGKVGLLQTVFCSTSHRLFKVLHSFILWAWWLLELSVGARCAIDVLKCPTERLQTTTHPHRLTQWPLGMMGATLCWPLFLDHMTFIHCSGALSLCSHAKCLFSIISISVFIKATQLFGPTLSCLH